MLLLVWLFVFKQKTAYEMRISDWSSDVCSSDLGTSKLRPGNRGRRQGARLQMQQTRPQIKRGRMKRAGVRSCGRRPCSAQFAGESALVDQIGRASVRESVSQSVSISVGAGSFKKQQDMHTESTINFKHTT